MHGIDGPRGQHHHVVGLEADARDRAIVGAVARVRAHLQLPGRGLEGDPVEGRAVRVDFRVRPERETGRVEGLDSPGVGGDAGEAHVLRRVARHRAGASLREVVEPARASLVPLDEDDVGLEADEDGAVVDAVARVQPDFTSIGPADALALVGAHVPGRDAHLAVDVVGERPRQVLARADGVGARPSGAGPRGP